MFSAHPSVRAVTAAILASLLSCSSALPRNANFASPESFSNFMSVPLAVSATTGPTCSSDPEPGSTSSPTSEAVPAPDIPPACVTPITAHEEPEINGCLHAVISAAGCKNYEELVRADLLAMGKNGQKILNARERILEILAEPNACADWYHQKDSNPLETFRTLNFIIDRKGTNFISEIRESPSLIRLFNPYVAKVIQEGGSYQAITLNAEGAFFQAQATVMEVAKAGGPTRLHGAHTINVGPYQGGTVQAQIATLLHEFGHIIGLLPHDEGDVDGRSVQNTLEVLRYCHAEIETVPKRNTLSASR